MKPIKHKKLIVLGALGLGTVLLTSCTANFCSNADKASMAYPWEQGVTVYLSKSAYENLKTNGTDDVKKLIEKEEQWSDQAETLGLPRIAGPAFTDPSKDPDDPASGYLLNEFVYKYVPYSGIGDKLAFTSNKVGGVLKETLSTASTAGYSLPGMYYFAAIDDYALKASTVEFLLGTDKYALDPSDTGDHGRYSNVFYRLFGDDAAKAELSAVYAGDEANLDFGTDIVAVNPYIQPDPEKNPVDIPIEKSILRRKGSIKFTGINDELYGYMNQWRAELREDVDLGFPLLGSFDVPTEDFFGYYKNKVNTRVEQVRSCIATRTGDFGHYGSFFDWRVAIEQKDWGYAWGKGFLEGILVYPVTWLLDTMAYQFDPALAGVGQIWALVIITLLIRGILLAVSFRSTLDGQKMQALQPELQKLQAKYPNSNTNQAEKQRLSQEQMALYRRHGIKPFRQLIIMIFQFPVFICVWAGLQGSAALSTGEFLNMRLSDNINSILFNTTGTWYFNTTGWWTALVLFILMAFTQIMAMMLPRIIQKIRNKNVPKLSKNPAADQSGRTMKLVSYGMIIFTIVMGFFLPSAMGIYWLIGGLISMVQTLITQMLLGRPKKKKGK